MMRIQCVALSVFFLLIISSCNKNVPEVPSQMQGTWCFTDNNIKYSPTLTIKEDKIFIWDPAFNRQFKYIIDELNVSSSNDSIIMNAKCHLPKAYFKNEHTINFKATLFQDTLTKGNFPAKYVKL